MIFRPRFVLPRAAVFIVAILCITVPRVVHPLVAAADQWLQFDTDHFKVIYREADAAAAARVGHMAPSVWERTTEFLQYKPAEPIPVVLYGETARANGFFTPYPPHVSLFTAAPAGPWMGARTEDWLESVFVHEVTHYLHLMQPIGFFGTASRVFGPLAAAGGTLFLPGWALEGPTTTAETTLTSGGRGRNPYFEMEWVAPILADEMYSYDQAGVASAYPPRGRIYSAGYILTDHLLREYGEDAFVELNREFQRWPFLGMRRALRRTTGYSGPEVHRNMVEELAARYASRRGLPGGTTIAPTDPLSERHLLGMTDRGAVALHQGAFNPGSVQLLREDGVWRDLAAVTPLDEYSVAVSADGKRAAAVVRRTNRATSGANVSYGDLYLLDLMAKTRNRRVTTDARLFHPAVDESGTIVVATERAGRFSRLVDIDTETGIVTPIYAPTERFLSMPALSRDGRYVTVVENYSGAQSIVVLERSDSQTATTVLRINVGGEHDAEYRPRFVGERDIWFVADPDGLLQLYRATIPDAGGDEPPRIERVLTDQVGVVSGVPTVDGTILYGTYRSHGYTVRRGSPTPRLVDRPDPDPEPTDVAAARRSGESTDGSLPASTVRSESRRYWDVPRPVLWVPTVRIAGEVSGTTRVDVGGGVIAAGNLARHDLQVFAAYNPTDHKPSGSLAYTYSWGPTTIALGAVADYSVESDGSLQDRGEISATLTRPILYDENPTRYFGLIGQVGSVYEIGTEGADSRHASVNGAMRLMRYRYGGSGHIFGGTGGTLQATLQYRPELLDQEEPELASITTGSLRLGRRTGQLFLEPLAAVTGSTTGEAVANLPWRSSPFAPEGRGAITAADTAILGRIALTGIARPLDAAWRGISLHNVASALYVSQAAHVEGPVSGTSSSNVVSITEDNYAVAGAELTLHGRFNLLPLQVTAGMALRLPHADEAGARRTQFYVNLGGAALDQVSTTPRFTP